MFNLLEKAPRHVSANVNFIHTTCIGHCVNVVLEKLGTEIVVQNLIDGEIILTLNTGSVLRNVDCGSAVPVAYPVEEFTNSDWVRPEPYRLCFRPNVPSSSVDREKLNVSQMVLRSWRVHKMLDEIGTVRVRAEEVVASFDQGSFFGSKLWKSFLDLLAD